VNKTEDKMNTFINALNANYFINSLKNYAHHFVGVLNSEWQLVFINEKFFSQYSASDLSQMIGKKAGAIFGCKMAFCIADEGIVTPNCSDCQLLSLLQETMDKKCHTEGDVEITIDSNVNEKIFYRVDVEYFNFENESYIILFMENQTENTRKHLMERFFYHDVLNSVASSISLITLLEIDDFSKDAVSSYFPLLKYHSNEVLEQLRFQRKLSLSEYGTDSIQVSTFNLSDIIHHNVRLYNFLNSIENHEENIRITDLPDFIEMNTDETLTGRIIHNLIKNAEEAVCMGEFIDIKVKNEPEYIELSISNPGELPDNIKAGIFKKIISTKSKQRGLGTYSMKFLSTKLLKGNIYFSSENNRTKFTLNLPKDIHKVK